jgi:hypothetical protein
MEATAGGKRAYRDPPPRAVGQARRHGGVRKLTPRGQVSAILTILNPNQLDNRATENQESIALDRRHYKPGKSMLWIDALLCLNQSGFFHQFTTPNADSLP